MKVLNPIKNLQTMEFKFTQFEIESRISRILDFGDETKIAHLLGISPTYISQQCNPHDERKSNFVKACEFVCAELEVDQTRGRELLQLFNRTVSLHVTERAQSKAGATRDFMRELEEFLTCSMLGKSDEECLDELDDVIERALELKKSLKKKEKVAV